MLEDLEALAARRNWSRITTFDTVQPDFLKWQSGGIRLQNLEAVSLLDLFLFVIPLGAKDLDKHAMKIGDTE